MLSVGGCRAGGPGGAWLQDGPAADIATKMARQRATRPAATLFLIATCPPAMPTRKDSRPSYARPVQAIAPLGDGVRPRRFLAWWHSKDGIWTPQEISWQPSTRALVVQAGPEGKKGADAALREIHDHGDRRPQRA